MLDKFFRKAQELAASAVATYHEAAFAEKGAPAFAAGCGWRTGHDGAERLAQQAVMPDEITLMTASIQYDAIADAVQQQVINGSKTKLKEFAFNNSGAVRYAFRDLALDWSSDALAFIDATEAQNGYRGLLITKRGMACNVTCDTPIMIPWSCFAASCATVLKLEQECVFLRFSPAIAYVFVPGKAAVVCDALNAFLNGIKAVLWQDTAADELRCAALSTYNGSFRDTIESFRAGDAQTRLSLKPLLKKVYFSDCRALSRTESEIADCYAPLFTAGEPSDFLALCQEVAEDLSAAAPKRDDSKADGQLSVREQAAGIAAAHPPLEEAFSKLAAAYDEECRLREERQRKALAERLDAFHEDAGLYDFCADLLDILECAPDKDLTREEQAQKELERFPELAERFDALCKQYHANTINRALKAIDHADPDDPEALYDNILKIFGRTDRFSSWWRHFEAKLTDHGSHGNDIWLYKCFAEQCLPSLEPNFLFADDSRLYSPKAYYIYMYIGDDLLDEAIDEYRDRYMLRRLEKLLSAFQMEQRLLDIVLHDDVAAVEQEPELLEAADDLGMDLLLYTALYHAIAPRLVACFAAGPERIGNATHKNILGHGVTELAAFSDAYSICMDPDKFYTDFGQYASLCARLGDAPMAQRLAKMYPPQGDKNGTQANYWPLITSTYKNAIKEVNGSIRGSITSINKEYTDAQAAQAEKDEEDLRHKRNKINAKLRADTARMKKLNAALGDDQHILDSWIEQEIEKSVQDMEKDEFETTAEFKERLNAAKEEKRHTIEADLDRQRGELAPGALLPCISQEHARIRKALAAVEQNARLQKSILAALRSPIFSEKKRKELLHLCYLRACCAPLEFQLGTYDADREVFIVEVDLVPDLGYLDFVLPVQRSLARQFKADFDPGMVTWDIDISGLRYVEYSEIIESDSIIFDATYRFGVQAPGIDFKAKPVTIPLLRSPNTLKVAADYPEE